MRTMTCVLLVCAASGCAGFKSVERGEWRLVWKDPSNHDEERGRAVIARDAYESEVSEGTRRGVENPQGFVYPWLHETDTVGLKVGEIAGFRVDEATEAELLVDGGNVQLFWGPVEKHDSWKGDTDVTVRESALFVQGTKAGKATLRLVRGPDTKDVPVTVQ